MAYGFTGATHVIKRADAVVTTWPITLAVRFRLTTLSTAKTLIGLYEAAAFDGFRLDITNLNAVQCITRAAGSADSATSTTTVSDNNWHTAIGEITAANARQVWLDNGGNASASVSKTPGTITKTVVGAREAGSTLSQNTGFEVADGGIWAGTFSADQRAAYNAGISPALVKLGVLKVYLPLIAAAIDAMGGAFTVTGAGVVAHPRVYMPARPGFIAPPVSTFTYSVSGGMQLAGTSSVTKSKQFLPSGGLQTGGSATLAKIKATGVSGGAQLGGAASWLKIKTAAPSGGALFAGSAAHSLAAGLALFAYGGGGALLLGGKGVCDFRFNPKFWNPPPLTGRRVSVSRRH